MTAQPPEKSKVPAAVSEYMKAMGARGGAKKGITKVRGTREHYRNMALARWGRKPSP